MTRIREGSPITIDSAYYPESYRIDLQIDFDYIFNHESIGGLTVNPVFRVVDSETGVVSWIEPAVGTFERQYAGQEPIYQRGNIHFYTDPMITEPNVDLYIFRDTPITQELDLIPYTPAPMESVEFAVDKLTLILQEIDGEKCACPWGGTVENPDPPVVIPPDPGTCVWVAPTDDVNGVVLYDEAVENLSAFGDEGVFGVEGDVIIANPGGGKVIHSIDGGATWSTSGTLPATWVTNVWGANRWEYLDGWWYAYAFTGSESRLQRTSDYGLTWEEINLLNGQRNIGGQYGFTIDNGNMIHFTRNTPTGLPQIGLLRRDLPDATSILNEISFNESGDSRWLGNMDDGYLMVNGTADIYYVPSDYSSFDKWQPSNLTAFNWADTNKVDLGLMYDNSVGLLRWDLSVGQSADLPVEPSAPVFPAAGEKLIQWNDTEKHWLLCYGGDGDSQWDMYDSDQLDGTGFRPIITLNLPVDQSSTTGDADKMFMRYSGSGTTWYAWYLKAGTRRVVIIKFDYGEIVCT